MTTGAKNRIVLDAGPLLRYLRGIEPGARRVAALLGEAKAGKAEVIMSDVNVSEVGRKIREAFRAQGTDLLLALRSAGVRIRWSSDDVVREVMESDLPLADAYAYATARVLKARLWITDAGDLGRLPVRKRIPVTILGKPRP